MLVSLVLVYLVMQLLALAVLPLALRLFANLPDRGYAFAKSLGILLGGFVLWIGMSYGLLRNEIGGAWLALLLVAGVSWTSGRSVLRELAAARDPSNLSTMPRWSYILTVELLFAVVFVTWAVVRAYDPAANHTEKPMDLMFMNSIWSSPTYPPRDGWFAGYAISYYYFGYWLLTYLGRLAGHAPEIIFNLGQAAWYALLLLGCFGVGYNLLAVRDAATGAPPNRANRSTSAILGGLLAAIAVGVTGNLQGALEWLYANGAPLARIADWTAVHGFPENAAVSKLWHIGTDWWWWRSSRVIEDLDLLGQHIEVIDEFPIFSYVLGDNHPHVLAMPFAILVIALGLNLFLQRVRLPAREAGRSWRTGADLLAVTPMGVGGLVLIVIATGALIFLNTWDFPPYWLLLSLAVFSVLLRAQADAKHALRRALSGAGLFAGLVLVGTLVLYLPYFLTAQNQAGGLIPNLFNPTRLPQFLLMFGYALAATGALLVLGWQESRPTAGKLGAAFAAAYGLPLLFLLAGIAVALGSQRGRQLLSSVALPPGAASHLPFIVQRWRGQALTFLLLGAMTAIVVALLWQRWERVRQRTDQEVNASTFFVLLLAGIGLLLVFAPEFVFLRDNFGTRMNTVFKFYYQGWLLLGLSSAYAIVASFRPRARPGKALAWPRLAPVLLSGVALLLIGLGLVYPVTAAYSKTGGFRGEPTFDATAYIAAESPAEFAAIEWIRRNTPPDARVLEGKGASYWATHNRVSTLTGRPTLLGWEGHESQWRGRSYGQMVHMRPETLQAVYSSGSTTDLGSLLEEWDIDYVYVGPTERSQYAITPRTEERLTAAMDLVFELDGVQIYRRREP